MPHATTSPPGTVVTYINYILEPTDGKSYPIQHFQTAGYRRQKHNTQPVQVTDVRSCDQEFKIDVNGFQFVKCFDAGYDEFKDDETVKKEVYPKAIEFLKKELGATKVHVFNHILRREPYQKQLDIPKDIPDEEKIELHTPAVFAHVDQSYNGALQLLNNIEEAPSYIPLSQTRWGVVNLWHALKPVTREPIAVLDWKTTNPSTDLRETTYRMEKENPRPDKPGLWRMDNYVWNLAHNPEHRWYYKSGMDESDALLIKCFDTKMDGRARCAGHSAVVLRGDEGPARESIEMRCLVFWEDQPHEGEEEERFVSDARDNWVKI